MHSVGYVAHIQRCRVSGKNRFCILRAVRFSPPLLLRNFATPYDPLHVKFRVPVPNVAGGRIFLTLPGRCAALAFCSITCCAL